MSSHTCSLSSHVPTLVFFLFALYVCSFIPLLSRARSFIQCVFTSVLSYVPSHVHVSFLCSLIPVLSCVCSHAFAQKVCHICVFLCDCACVVFCVRSCARSDVCALISMSDTCVLQERSVMCSHVCSRLCAPTPVFYSCVPSSMCSCVCSYTCTLIRALSSAHAQMCAPKCALSCMCPGV